MSRGNEKTLRREKQHHAARFGEGKIFGILRGAVRSLMVMPLMNADVNK